MKFFFFLMATLSGATSAFAYPSTYFEGHYLLTLIAFTFLFFLIHQTKETFKIILFFLLGFNFAGYYWIPHTLREFGQIPYILSLILGLGFALILQPYLWAIVFLKKTSLSFLRSSTEQHFFIALILTLAEIIVPQQFPTFAGSTWLTMAPHVFLVPYFGVCLFSFFTYWFCLEVAFFLHTKKIHLLPIMTCLLFFTLNFIPRSNEKAHKTLSLRMVQANIGNFIKISSESGNGDALLSVIQKYQDLSLRNLPPQTDLIIWPETAYPHTFQGVNTPLDKVFQLILTQTQADLLIGGYDQKVGGSSFDYYETIYNSSLLMSENRIKNIYHKNLLLPFGETLPFGPLNKNIAELVPAVSLFAKGEKTPLMQTKNGFNFITPICYEILETNYIRSMLNQNEEIDFIVNHTNDSWYGNTSEPHQHLFLAKWRAVEFLKPIIRVTNTGFSSVIFPTGLDSKRIDLNYEGTLDMRLPLAQNKKTWVQEFGYLPSIMIIVFIGFCFLAARRLKSRFEKIM